MTDQADADDVETDATTSGGTTADEEHRVQSCVTSRLSASISQVLLPGIVVNVAVTPGTHSI